MTKIWSAIRIRLPRFIRRPTLQQSIMSLIGSVFLGVFLTICISVIWFIHQTELTSWRDRQREAAHAAAQTIAAFLQRNEATLHWIGVMGLDEVESRPEILEEVLDESPAFFEIAIVDRNGRVMADVAHDRAVLTNLFTIPQAEWFYTARAGEKYYTTVQLSAQNEPYLIFALPVRNGGVIAARVRMDVLQQVVSDIHFGESGSVFVVNQDGLVNAHTDMNLVLNSRSLADSPEFQAMLQSPDNEWYGERWDFNHRRVVSVSTAIGVSGWILVAELPATEAYATTLTIGSLLPAGLLALIFLAVWAIRSDMRRIVLNPLIGLRDGAARLGEGDLGYRLIVPRQDELGDVMLSFNQMADRLESEHTAMQQQAEELRASQKLYRLLADNASDVIWLRDLSLQTLYLSPSVLQLRGYTSEEAMAQPLSQTLTPASFEKSAQFLLEVLARASQMTVEQLQTSSRTLETEVTCKDGATLWAETTMRFLLDEAGQPYQILGVTRDISKRRQAELDLRALNEQLEARVNARTAELSELNRSLVKEIEEHQLTEALLHTSLREKEVLLKEIHHRVKNNLQIIGSLLSLQARKSQNLQVLQAFQDSQDRVRSIALIHEKLYQSDNLAQIRFAGYLQSLVDSLVKSYRRNASDVQVLYELDDLPLTLESALPCGLIVNELVANSLKYAFPDQRAGVLTIGFRKDGVSRLTLWVADNGIGLPADLDARAANSLGMQLINSLTGQLDGELKIERQNGASFKITFPYRI